MMYICTIFSKDQFLLCKLPVQRQSSPVFVPAWVKIDANADFGTDVNNSDTSE